MWQIVIQLSTILLLCKIPDINQVFVMFFFKSYEMTGVRSGFGLSIAKRMFLARLLWPVQLSCNPPDQSA
jgi:hypothetical protein